MRLSELIKVHSFILDVQEFITCAESTTNEDLDSFDISNNIDDILDIIIAELFNTCGIEYKEGYELEYNDSIIKFYNNEGNIIKIIDYINDNVKEDYHNKSNKLSENEFNYYIDMASIKSAIETHLKVINSEISSLPGTIKNVNDLSLRVEVVSNLFGSLCKRIEANNLNLPIKDKKETLIKPTKEMVNHPNHYNREGAIECLDEMILKYGYKAVITFCILNADKYRYRAADKNGSEDIKKSDFYMNKAKEICDKYEYYPELNIN